MTAMKYAHPHNGQAMTTVGVAQQPLQGFKYQVVCSLLWMVCVMSSSQHGVVDGEQAQAGSTASARGRLDRQQPQQQQPQEQQPQHWQDPDLSSLARDAETSPSTPHSLVARRQRRQQRELQEQLLLQQEQQQQNETMVTGAGVTHGVADYRVMRDFENVLRNPHSESSEVDDWVESKHAGVTASLLSSHNSSISSDSIIDYKFHFNSTAGAGMTSASTAEAGARV